MIVAVALALVAGAAVSISRISGSGASDVLDSGGVEQAAVQRTATAVCTLVVPRAPLTAEGLATPYRLKGAAGGTASCNEATPGQSAFVEAVIYDPSRHALSVYRPVVVDDGDQPAAAPVPVSLPSGAVVGVWISFNGRTLTLGNARAGSCVDGETGSPFGTFAYCNARAFFAAVKADHSLMIPALGTGTDGLPCPTSRDFAVVDQSQSDDVATAYRVLDGHIAQDTDATRTGAALTSGPGHRLLAEHIDPALGCTPFLAPDLTDGDKLTPSLALNELSAAAHQAHPLALVPANDPLTRVNGHTSVRKVNLLREGVNQKPFPAGLSREDYCGDIAGIAPGRLKKDADLLRAAQSPAEGADNLLLFMQQRLQATVHDLRCSSADARTVAIAAAKAGARTDLAAARADRPDGSGTSTGNDGSTTTTAGGTSLTGGTLWGSSVMAYGSETYAQAFARVEQGLHPQIIRFFQSGAPSWPSKTGSSPLVYSFSIPPQEVLSGSHDAQLAAFFAATPRLTYWSYLHEPEDNIEHGQFTAADYRAAWQHIAAIAHASGKPLRATLILMGFTAKASSHRNWADYYPGPDTIDVLAWDCYAWSTNDTPDSVYGSARAISVQAGKPWAIAETGVNSTKVTDPAQRSAELTAMSQWLATSQPAPAFVTYFDSDPAGDPAGFYGWNITRVPGMAAAWLAGQSG